MIYLGHNENFYKMCKTLNTIVNTIIKDYTSTKKLPADSNKNIRSFTHDSITISATGKNQEPFGFEVKDSLSNTGMCIEKEYADIETKILLYTNDKFLFVNITNRQIKLEGHEGVVSCEEWCNVDDFLTRAYKVVGKYFKTVFKEKYKTDNSTIKLNKQSESTTTTTTSKTTLFTTTTSDKNKWDIKKIYLDERFLRFCKICDEIIYTIRDIEYTSQLSKNNPYLEKYSEDSVNIMLSIGVPGKYGLKISNSKFDIAVRPVDNHVFYNSNISIYEKYVYMHANIIEDYVLIKFYDKYIKNLDKDWMCQFLDKVYDVMDNYFKNIFVTAYGISPDRIYEKAKEDVIAVHLDIPKDKKTTSNKSKETIRSEKASWK